ncbi:MAG TPA: LysR family transcriptional regulator [Gammaproteobacteria bacterium]|nr:LysR family transcriptional regulator [Gammaproteobacteria bacterium]
MSVLHELALEIRHLQLVRAVAEAGTLTAAAQRLCVTQSALSHRLRELEQRLGCAVFLRQGRRMIPTQVGDRLLAAARGVLDELERARQDLARMTAGELGEIRLSTGCYTAYHWLPRLLPAFQTRYPGVEIRLLPEAMGRLFEALRQRELDLAIASFIPDDPDIEGQRLFEDETLLLVHPEHPAAGRDSLPLQALATERLIIHGSTRSAYQSFLQRQGVQPREVTELMLSEAIVEWVAAGLGVTLMDRWAAKRYLDLGIVRGLSVAGESLRRSWYAVTLRGERPAYVQALAEMIRNNPPTREPVR